jgi:osmotically-inducible protein OsmY
MTQSIIRASETDDRIESSFIKSYVFQTYLHDDGIIARSTNGKVVLTGNVTEEMHKDLAMETMASLPGVTSVDNRLRVKGEHPKENSDKWVHARVKSTLLFHRNVNALKTDITVNNGIVTLRGQADNQAQKELTYEYAIDIKGVKAVKNEMSVAAFSPSLTEKAMDQIDDASITAQVKVSLLSRRSTSVLNTHVKTKDGTVTLTGKAENESEKSLVTKLTHNIYGVKSVTNEMIVSKHSNTK